MKYIKAKVKAGYTHNISYNMQHKTLGVVRSEFPTTSDMVKVHVFNMKKNKDISDIVVSNLKG